MVAPGDCRGGSGRLNNSTAASRSKCRRYRAPRGFQSLIGKIPRRMHKILKIRNPNLEIRNKLEIRRKTEGSKEERRWGLGFGISAF
jgi:hypothetical protein